MHALAAHIRSRFLPERQCFGVLAELDADFLQNAVRIVLDQAQAFLVQNLVFADLAGDVGQRRTRTATRAGSAARCGAPAGATAAPAAISLAAAPASSIS